MTRKRFDIRVAIGTVDGPRSSVWHFWSRNSEVYVVHGGMGGIEKFSFHTPNVCRRAFTKEHGKPSGLANRATHEWRRDPTPPESSKRVVRVLVVGFATDILSTALAPPKHKVIWVEPAPPGGSTVLDLMFTRDAEATLLEALTSEPQHLGHRLVAYNPLPNGEAFCVTSYHADHADSTLRMPASHGHKRDLIAFPKDPNSTGRPVRLTIFSNPADGEFMRVWEYGADWHAPLTDAEWEIMRKSVPA
jgi:hypothetical protein